MSKNNKLKALGIKRQMMMTKEMKKRKEYRR